MIILAWNNRGMARSSACRNLKAMVRSLNPSCLFIQETKVGEEKLDGLVRNLGFVNQCLIPAIRTGGGLLLGWWKEVDLEVTVANQRLINALVFNEPLNQPWMITFVHGPHSKSGRAPFLDHLNKLSDSFVGLWMCVGDFNYIRSLAEKKGGRPFVKSSRGELRQFLNQSNLIDLGFKENTFTWSNKRVGRSNIKERLDRVVANVE
jgi:hypothetical protein